MVSTAIVAPAANVLRRRSANIGNLLGGGEQGGRPIEALAAKPGGGESIGAMCGERFRNGGLVGLGGGGCEGECHFREAEFEQPVATARLAVVVALGRRATQDLDLPVVQPKAAVDRSNLRLPCPLVGQQQTGR